LDEEDYKLVDAIERKTGVKIPRIKKFLNKFQEVFSVKRKVQLEQFIILQMEQNRFLKKG